MTFDTISIDDNTVPVTNTSSLTPATVTSTPITTLASTSASSVPPPRIYSSAPVVDPSVSSGGRSSAQDSTSHVPAETSSSSPAPEQKMLHIRWDHPVITLFINKVMKPHYSDLVATQITQLKHEKWKAMLVKFKRILNQNYITKDVSTDNITTKKIQDKWASLKIKFLNIQEIVSSEGYVGVRGDNQWPYYSMVENALNYFPSKNTNVNTESMEPTNSPAIDLNPHEHQLQQNIQEAGASSVVDPAATYTTRSVFSSDSENIDDANSSEISMPPNRSINTGGGFSSAASSRKRRRESNDKDKLIRDMVEVVERINTQNMIRAQQNSERWIEALKEQGEVALKMQREHHRQIMELQRAYIDTINGLINRMREYDERCFNLLSSTHNPTNRRELGDDDTNKN